MGYRTDLYRTYLLDSDRGLVLKCWPCNRLQKAVSERGVGGQSIERRETLRCIGIAAVAAFFSGFSRWVFACPIDHPRQANPQPQSSLQPFFSGRTMRWGKNSGAPTLSPIVPEASCTDITTTMPIVAFTMRACHYMLDNLKRASTSGHETSGGVMITLGHEDPTVAKQESVCEA